MPVQQQSAASENLSGIDMMVKSVSTLRDAGFGQDQSLALAEAISGMISAELSACMKPFMDETSRRFQAIDDRLESMEETNKARFQAIDDRLESMEETNKARFQAIDDRLESMEKTNKVRHESIDGRLTSVEGKVDWLQKAMVTFAVGMGGSVVALTALFFGAVVMMLGQ